jgi:hypothetical protein
VHLHGEPDDLRHKDGQQYEKIPIADEEGFHGDSGIRGQRSEIRDQGSGIRDQGSGACNLRYFFDCRSAYKKLGPIGAGFFEIKDSNSFSRSKLRSGALLTPDL